jgi:putative ABC transport system permease protein
MPLSIKENVVVSLSDFWSRKIRVIVTIISIILGTMSIIVVQSLVKGVQDQTMAWMMERGGMTRIDVSRNWEFSNPKNLDTFLTLREFNQLRELLPEAEYITPQLISWSRINFQRNQFWGSIAGVTPEFINIEEWKVDRGRFIYEIDVDSMNDVIVIGSTMARELFENRNPVGQYLTFQNRRLMVVGVLARRHLENMGNIGSDNMLEYHNRRAYVPITTMIRKLSVEDKIEHITIKAADVGRTTELRDKTEDILLSLRQREPVFSVTSAIEQADQMAQGTKVFQIVFSVVSMISLLVAGIVIMNIMMASIQERTREIGIRMAVGASRFDIFMQFVIQTLIITLMGGILGVVAGTSILKLVSDYLSIKMTGSLTMVLVSLAIAGSVGLVFGIFPAVKASNLDPVKCLAYE